VVTSGAQAKSRKTPRRIPILKRCGHDLDLTAEL